MTMPCREGQIIAFRRESKAGPQIGLEAMAFLKPVIGAAGTIVADVPGMITPPPDPSALAATSIPKRISEFSVRAMLDFRRALPRERVERRILDTAACR